MNIENILRAKPARIISVRTDESIKVAARILHSEGVGALAVQDVCHSEGNTIVGLFSERDLVRVLAEQGPAALEKRIADFMTRRLYACAPGDAVERALGLMLEHHVRHLPVLDGFTLIGVISMREVTAAIAAKEDDERNTAIGGLGPRPDKSRAGSELRHSYS